MPKIKTHKSTVKRFRLSGSGKLLRRIQGQGHLKRKKSPALKSDYRDTITVDVPAAEKRIKKLVPYLGSK